MAACSSGGNRWRVLRSSAPERGRAMAGKDDGSRSTGSVEKRGGDGSSSKPAAPRRPLPGGPAPGVAKSKPQGRGSGTRSGAPIGQPLPARSAERSVGRCSCGGQHRCRASATAAVRVPASSADAGCTAEVDAATGVEQAFVVVFDGAGPWGVVGLWWSLPSWADARTVRGATGVRGASVVMGGRRWTRCRQRTRPPRRG